MENDQKEKEPVKPTYPLSLENVRAAYLVEHGGDTE